VRRRPGAFVVVPEDKDQREHLETDVEILVFPFFDEFRRMQRAQYQKHPLWSGLLWIRKGG